MADYDRTYPHGHEQHIALDADRFSRLFDGSQKVVAYWTTAPDTVTVVDYYSTVSAANTGAAAAVNANGAYPSVEINWSHPDISHIAVGPVQHPDADEDLPAWIDAEPAY